MIEEHLQEDRRLIQLEERAQREQWDQARKLGLKALEAEGLALRGLIAREDKSGFLGRTVVLFERTYGAERGGFRMRVGDPVIVRQQSQPEEAFLRAIIRRISPRTTELLFEDAPEDWLLEEVVACELGPNEVTFDRLREGIASMESAKGPQKVLRDKLLGALNVEAPKLKPQPTRPQLNAVQNEALDIIGSSPAVFLLHGPPGTGKTTTLSYAIAEAVKRGDRVLVCAPSNQAVDNIAMALLDRSVPLMRLGHPARMDPALWAHTLEGKLEKHPQKHVSDNLFAEAHLKFREAKQKVHQGRSLDARQIAQALRSEAKALLSEARKLEQSAANHLLDTTSVLLATLTGLRAEQLGNRHFDLGVIDEATQGIGPSYYPLVSRVDRVLLGGDHRQLGPTVLSKEADKKGLSVSLFERLMTQKVPPPSTMLQVQYRMHEQIMAYPSQALYEGKLQAAEQVAKRDLGAPANETFAPLLFIDTAGRGFEEEREDEATSYHNTGEAELALQLVRKLGAVGVEPSRVGLLSPYDAQVQLLRALALDEGCEANSVDGFQGREKDVIIVSLVRSNAKQEIGFLSELRRLNVALTRAKMALIVIGDSATITAHSFYNGFVDHAIAQGAHKSAWDFA